MFQEYEHIQHQLTETEQEGTLNRLALPNNTIMHMVSAEMRRAGYQPHNIDGLEKD